MEKFKVGDIVEYYKKPTYEDWGAVGEIYIPFEIGAMLEVTAIVPSSGALRTDKGGFFPKECFRLVEKREPEFIFGI
jgi:hypothetical protein